MKKLESPKSWAEIAGKHVDAKLYSVALNVENVNKALYLQKAREAALEEQDKECRRNNIIIYRVQESTATSAEDRLREDVRFCQNLLVNFCYLFIAFDATSGGPLACSEIRRYFHWC